MRNFIKQKPTCKEDLEQCFEEGMTQADKKQAIIDHWPGVKSIRTAERLMQRFGLSRSLNRHTPQQPTELDDDFWKQMYERRNAENEQLEKKYWHLRVIVRHLITIIKNRIEIICKLEENINIQDKKISEFEEEETIRLQDNKISTLEEIFRLQDNKISTLEESIDYSFQDEKNDDKLSSVLIEIDCLQYKQMSILEEIYRLKNETISAYDEIKIARLKKELNSEYI